MSGILPWRAFAGILTEGQAVYANQRVVQYNDLVHDLILGDDGLRGPGTRGGGPHGARWHFFNP